MGNVYFSDIPATTIHKVDKEGKLSTFTDMSNRANGLMFNGKGELVAAEMAGQIVAYDVATGKKRVLADKYDGKPFNAPNDLVVDRHGGVYFTDPDFGAAKTPPQDAKAVYYVAPDGKVSRVTGDLPKPNGVILSPDEKTLYVVPTGSADMLAYPVESPGKLGKSKVFCTLKQPEKKGKGLPGGDGLTIDTKGNLYITSALGLQVFAPDGTLLGIIRVPEQPANVTFGGPDNRTLYVTARTSLYTIPMEAQGHVFGKK
jgi:gluconolactonase